MGLATSVGFFLVQKGDLFYSRAAIIGLGDMGAAVASAARHLGMQVLGVRRSGLAHQMAHETFSIAPSCSWAAQLGLRKVNVQLKPAVVHQTAFERARPWQR